MEKCVRSDQVNLRWADNPWNPRRYMPRLMDREMHQIQGIHRKMRAILNKLTTAKFDSLSIQMCSLNVNSENRLRGVVDMLHYQAKNEHANIALYARMCKALYVDGVQQARPIDTRLFKNLLLTSCQREFEIVKHSHWDIGAKEAEIEMAESEQVKKRLQNELFDQRKVKRQSIGNILFIGELYKEKMMNDQTIHTCIQSLLASGNIELLCRLVTVVGKDLACSVVPQNKNALNGYMQRMHNIALLGQVSNRIRCMLLDVVDLRKNNWISQSVLLEEKLSKLITEQPTPPKSNPPASKPPSPKPTSPVPTEPKAKTPKSSRPEMNYSVTSYTRSTMSKNAKQKTLKIKTKKEKKRGKYKQPKKGKTAAITDNTPSEDNKENVIVSYLVLTNTKEELVRPEDVKTTVNKDNSSNPMQDSELSNINNDLSLGSQNDCVERQTVSYSRKMFEIMAYNLMTAMHKQQQAASHEYTCRLCKMKARVVLEFDRSCRNLVNDKSLEETMRQFEDTIRIGKYKQARVLVDELCAARARIRIHHDLAFDFSVEPCLQAPWIETFNRTRPLLEDAIYQGKHNQAHRFMQAVMSTCTEVVITVHADSSSDASVHRENVRMAKSLENRIRDGHFNNSRHLLKQLCHREANVTIQLARECESLEDHELMNMKEELVRPEDIEIADKSSNVITKHDSDSDSELSNIENGVSMGSQSDGGVERKTVAYSRKPFESSASNLARTIRKQHTTASHEYIKHLCKMEARVVVGIDRSYPPMDINFDESMKLLEGAIRTGEYENACDYADKLSEVKARIALRHDQDFGFASEPCLDPQWREKFNIAKPLLENAIAEGNYEYAKSLLEDVWSTCTELVIDVHEDASTNTKTVHRKNVKRARSFENRIRVGDFLTSRIHLRQLCQQRPKLTIRLACETESEENDLDPEWGEKFNHTKPLLENAIFEGNYEYAKSLLEDVWSTCTELVIAVHEDASTDICVHRKNVKRARSFENRIRVGDFLTSRIHLRQLCQQRPKLTIRLACESDSGENEQSQVEDHTPITTETTNIQTHSETNYSDSDPTQLNAETTSSYNLNPFVDKSKGLLPKPCLLPTPEYYIDWIGNFVFPVYTGNNSQTTHAIKKSSDTANNYYIDRTGDYKKAESIQKNFTEIPNTSESNTANNFVNGISPDYEHNVGSKRNYSQLYETLSTSNNNVIDVSGDYGYFNSTGQGNIDKNSPESQKPMTKNIQNTHSDFGINNIINDLPLCRDFAIKNQHIEGDISANDIYWLNHGAFECRSESTSPIIDIDANEKNVEMKSASGEVLKQGALKERSEKCDKLTKDMVNAITSGSAAVAKRCVKQLCAIRPHLEIRTLSIPSPIEPKPQICDNHAVVTSFHKGRPQLEAAFACGDYTTAWVYLFDLMKHRVNVYMDLLDAYTRTEKSARKANNKIKQLEKAIVNGNEKLTRKAMMSLCGGMARLSISLVTTNSRDITNTKEKTKPSPTTQNVQHKSTNSATSHPANSNLKTTDNSTEYESNANNLTLFKTNSENIKQSEVKLDALEIEIKSDDFQAKPDDVDLIQNTTATAKPIISDDLKFDNAITNFNTDFSITEVNSLGSNSASYPVNSASISDDKVNSDDFKADDLTGKSDDATNCKDDGASKSHDSKLFITNPAALSSQINTDVYANSNVNSDEYKIDDGVNSKRIVTNASEMSIVKSVKFSEDFSTHQVKSCTNSTLHSAPIESPVGYPIESPIESESTVNSYNATSTSITSNTHSTDSTTSEVNSVRNPIISLTDDFETSNVDNIHNLKPTETPESESSDILSNLCQTSNALTTSCEDTVNTSSNGNNISTDTITSRNNIIASTVNTSSNGNISTDTITSCNNNTSSVNKSSESIRDFTPSTNISNDGNTVSTSTKISCNATTSSEYTSSESISNSIFSTNIPNDENTLSTATKTSNNNSTSFENTSLNANTKPTKTEGSIESERLKTFDSARLLLQRLTARINHKPT